MAKIAIYDRFYQTQRYPHSDIVGQALADSGHEVIGAATDLRQAARQILDFAGRDVAERPDIVIMGGMLDGETDYHRSPLTITEPCTVRRRTWWGGVREETGRRITFLLPQFGADGVSYRFPDIVPVGRVSEEPPSELHRQWNVGLGGIAACVLSRVAQTYLPEAARLGVSVNPMIDAELSARWVDRHSSDSVQQLQGRIRRLAGAG